MNGGQTTIKVAPKTNAPEGAFECSEEYNLPPTKGAPLTCIQGAHGSRWMGWPGVGARSLKNLPRCPIEPVNSCYLVNLQVRLFGCVRCADAGGGLCLLKPFVGALEGG